MTVVCILVFLSNAGVIIGGGRTLVTGSQRGIKLWNITGLSALDHKSTSTQVPPQVTVQDEMELDGYVTSAAFDDNFDMVKVK